MIRDIKLSTYLNIATCNIKCKAYSVAVLACEEALKLDPSNFKALYRRARATALPINAGVPEMRKALKDLVSVYNLASKVNGKTNYILKEK
jgi:tetratricopeptide (TPR) repeat protein